MTDEELETVLILLDKFRWTDDSHSRFSALRILRSARGEPPPLWDDFLVGR